MVTTSRTLLLLFCFLPSLSSAWCSGNGSERRSRSASFSPRQDEHCPNLAPSFQSIQVDNQYYHRKNHREHRRAVKLWSNISNGGGQHDGKDDGDIAKGIEQKMTLRRASKLLSTFWSMAFPYYQESQPGRRLFIGMVLLTLVNSGVSVAFSYVSKDFWNALSSKDTQEFYSMMLKYGGALVVGAPVSVLYR